jgi:hypothetical protein
MFFPNSFQKSMYLVEGAAAASVLATSSPVVSSLASSSPSSVFPFLPYMRKPYTSAVK